MNKKRIISATMMGLVTLAPFAVKTTSVIADGLEDNQTNAERADITNWVANSTEQIQSNMQEQNIDVNNLNNTVYIVRWGDTLSGISDATGISIDKLAYDNHIENVDLIYAGQRLVLNKDGQVPTNYHYKGTGKTCAYSPIIINNYDLSDNSVNKKIINNSPVKEVVIKEAQKDEDEFKPNADNVDKAGLNGDLVRKDGQGLEKAQSDQSSTASSASSSTTNASSSSESKTSTSSKSDVKSDKESESKELSSDEFTKAVEDAINTKLNDSSISFIDPMDTTATLEDSEDVFDTDESASTTGKMTEETAEKLADEITSALQESDKFEDLTKASKAKLTITQDGEDFEYNVSFESSEDESSEESSEDVDSESEETESSSSTDTESSESNAVDTNDESEDEDY